MSDRRWLAILCISTSAVILIYPQMSDTFGPRMTNYIEGMLGVHHMVAVVLQIIVALALLAIGLRLYMPASDFDKD